MASLRLKMQLFLINSHPSHSIAPANQLMFINSFPTTHKKVY